MKVGFSKTWGGVLLGMGLVCLLLGLVAGNLPAAFPGLVSLVAGAFMMGRTYFEIGGGVLVVHALIGPVTRRYPYDSPRDVRVEGNKIFVGAKKVGVAKSQADARDWQAFLAYVERERAAA